MTLTINDDKERKVKGHHVVICRCGIVILKKRTTLDR